MISFSNAVGRIDSSEIRKLFDLAAKLKDPVNLSIGEPDFPVPEPVKEAMIRAIRENKTAYTPTQGILPLREALSERWASEAIKIDPSHIVVSAGVAPLLFFIFETLFNEGDEIVIIEPYFLMYESLARFNNLKVRYLPEDFDASHVNELLLEKDFSPKAVIFSTPSNPTGRILSREQLVELARYGDQTGALLISDEIYCSFDYDRKFVPTASVAPERTITLGGFSKSYAMTGLRVGYMGVPSSLAGLYEKVAALQQYSVVCSPQPSQWGALEALKTPLVSELALMKKRRDLVTGLLGQNVKYSSADGAFYIFAEVPVEDIRFVEAAIEKELLVVPGKIFTRKKNFVRISYAQKEEKLRSGIQIFLDTVKDFM